MKCPACKGPMRPLFTSWFCPKDCDRPRVNVPSTISDVDFAKLTAPYAPVVSGNTFRVFQQPISFVLPWGLQQWEVRYGEVFVVGDRGWWDPTRMHNTPQLMLSDMKRSGGRAPGKPGDPGLPGWAVGSQDLGTPHQDGWVLTRV